MLIAMVLLPLMDVIAKYLTQSMASGQIVWGRMLFQSLFLLPFMWPLRHKLSVNQWYLFAIRGVLIATATLFFFTALTKLPVADALAIFFIEPLLLTLLSALFLGEKIGIRRASAVLVGFAGALIIIQPSATAFGIYAILPLGAAFCFACYLVITRKLAQTNHAVLIQLYTGIAGLITVCIALMIGNALGIQFLTISAPTGNEWGLLILLGGIGCVGHLLVVLAFSFADASMLAPFQYFEIIGAVVFGWYFFSDMPALSTWIGIAIIVGSGLYVYLREQQLGTVEDNK